MNELVSVIITTYKRDVSILNDAIVSVLNQTYSDIELIIIDDNGLGSCFQKQNEDFIKSNYTFIKYLPNNKNEGVQVSRNIGILSSNARYVAFLDDDDYWLPQKIEKQMDTILQSESIGLVFCDGYYMKDLNNVDKKRDHDALSFEIPIDYITLLHNDYIGTTTQALIRKECFAKSGLFDISLPARQDYDMWLRISKYYQIKGINEPLYLYRVHDGEQISKSTKKVLVAFKIIRKKYYNDLKKNREALSRITLKIGKRECNNKSYLRGVLEILTAMLISPKYIFKRVVMKRMF